MNKNKTLFDNFKFIFTEHPTERKKYCYAVIAKHKYIPNFEFHLFRMGEEEMYWNEVGEFFNELSKRIYLCSLYGKAAKTNISNLFYNDDIRFLTTGEWDKEKEEWFIVDSEGNKQYESSFIPKQI